MDAEHSGRPGAEEPVPSPHGTGRAAGPSRLPVPVPRPAAPPQVYASLLPHARRAVLATREALRDPAVAAPAAATVLTVAARLAVRMLSRRAARKELARSRRGMNVPRGRVTRVTRTYTQTIEIHERP